RNEILAGANIGTREPLIVGGQPFEVVGVLKPSVALLADSCLVPTDEKTDKLFSTAVPSVLHAWLVPGSASDLRDAGFLKRTEEAFPPEKYASVPTEDRLDARAFQLYLVGLAIFLLG